MYKRFFGLKKNPFNVNPDPAYLYLTPQIGQALDELTYGIENRKGLMLLTGEAGTGKTTLINHLLLWLAHQRAHTAFIFNSHVDSRQLFDFILADFEIPLTPEAKSNPLLVFHEWLLARFQAQDLVVLIVDEAQGLPVPVLEEIRLLLNMETPNEKLLQVVLAGQPELEVKLRRPDLRQLRQRIALRCNTAPLTLQETHAYIENRLHTAGARNHSLFQTEAVEAVHNYSRGIPRVINLLCENALINAYVEQLTSIPAEIIAGAAQDLQFDEYKPLGPRVRPIQLPVNVPELNSLLARIKADADQTWAQPSTSKVSPFLVSAPQPGNLSPATPCADDESDDRNIALIPVESPDVGHARQRVVVWRRKRSNFEKFVTAKVAAARALSQNLELRSRIKPAVKTIQGLQLLTKTRKFAGDFRVAVQPRLQRLWQSAGPEVRGRTAALAASLKTRAASATRWLSCHVGEEMYGKIFVASAVITALLYLIARKMSSGETWQHPGHLIVAFAGMLLCALSIGLGAAILLRSRQKLLADASELLHNAMRWLRAPIYPLHIRELESIGKAQTERRA
ncbi:MAG: AAA family ATPase [Candidatus Acidiferrum sp.]